VKVVSQAQYDAWLEWAIAEYGGTPSAEAPAAGAAAASEPPAEAPAEPAPAAEPAH
jgi:cytochrome c oxidase subunit 2